jgi:hypothetical protein
MSVHPETHYSSQSLYGGLLPWSGQIARSLSGKVKFKARPWGPDFLLSGVEFMWDLGM